MAFSFTLTPEQQQLQSSTREFARTVLRPLAQRVAAEPDPLTRALLTRPAFEQGVAAGMLSSLIPPAVGGTGGRGIDAAVAIEEVAAEFPDYFINMAGPLIALMPVYAAGTPEQIERFVRPFLATSRAPLAAMAFSEPEGSANFDAPPPAGVQTTAVPDGDVYVINGRKAWASFLSGWDGDGPDIMTIVCRAPGGVSVIVAEREHLAGHIEVEEHYDLPGLRGCLTSRVRLHDMRVPKTNLIGAEGDGIRLTRNAFLPSGASIGVFATGAMRRAFDIAWEFATTDSRGGSSPIINHQSVADVLANAKGRIEATRLLSWRAMDAVLGGHPAGAEWALHSKIFGSDTALSVVNELVQAVGVTAYDMKHPLMTILNTVLAYPIIEGGNIGIRRRQLQAMLADPSYDPSATLSH
ncbi:acyl-CoA dehydrogenase family protein [Gordonia sp. CPCC 205515]|uniref:acyl-CoA dehydrogenase family protein n=1 Tax=Gordonia sp. CPCC 205515 TaxID=3140791 RepID=UPI003AF3E668